MRIEPMGENVIVKRLDADEKTAGGIVLPGTAREKPAQGRVLSVGEGHLLPDGSRVPHQVSEGDRVLFSPYAGVEVRCGESEVLIMSAHDILAVLE